MKFLARYIPQLTGTVSLIGLIFSMPVACVADNVVPAALASRRANAAYLAKLGQCDQDPDYVIPFTHDVEESILLQCEGDLLSGSCPVSDQMPVSCLVALIKEPPADDSDGR